MKISPAQLRTLRKALAAAPASIGTGAASKPTLFALDRLGLLVATYTPFHSATDRPTYRISNRGRALLASLDATPAE